MSRRGAKKCEEPGEKAIWDTDNTRIFLECIVKQICLNNRPFSTLTELGYVGAQEKFKNITGKSHKRQQFKNKYDDMKQEWVAWLFLKDPQRGTTGVGWDAEKGTFVMEDRLWNAYSLRVKNIKKFKRKGLEHLDLMKQVYGGIAATGEATWTPSSDFDLNLEDFESQEPCVPDSENDCVGSAPPHYEFAGIGTSSSQQATGVRTQTSGQKRSSEGLIKNKEPVKKKNTGAYKLSYAMQRLIDVVESQGTSLIVDSRGSSVLACLEKLDALPGLQMGTPLYFYAVNKMENDRSREVFMGLQSDDLRLAWLKCLFPDNLADFDE